MIKRLMTAITIILCFIVLITCLVKWGNITMLVIIWSFIITIIGGALFLLYKWIRYGDVFHNMNM